MGKGKDSIKAAKSAGARGKAKGPEQRQSRLGDRFINARPNHAHLEDDEKTPGYKRRFQDRKGNG